MAHEINNPLQTIIGCTELMIEEQRSAGRNPDLEMVRHEAARAGEIVRNLLAFVRRSPPNRSAADLNQIARATAHLREHQLMLRNVALTLELHPGVLPVLVNREEIQQVVLNLVLNAEHAIGDAPGAITIRTLAAGRAHVLQVADTGPGISAELKGRVFEPFFTTKEVGEGTGLGLSIALGIARAHGGCWNSARRMMEARSRRPIVQPTTGDRQPATVSRSADNRHPATGKDSACFQLTLPAHSGDAAREFGDLPVLTLRIGHLPFGICPSSV